MSRPSWVLLFLVAIVAVGIGGYWVGYHGTEKTAPITVVAQTAMTVPQGPVIYYRDPDNKPYYSLEPKQTPEGRAWRAVRASEDVSFDGQAKADVTPAADQSGSQQILYYRHPMGLPDISPTPKRDSMGMDYIPVYEGEGDDGSSITLSPGKLQQLGVKSERAQMRIISEPVRAPGTIQLDERRIAVISLRFEAFIERVENVTTGSEVSQGQPLMRIYSPAIAAAASEYLSILNLGGDAARLSGARQRLVNLAIPPNLLSDIERTREVPLTFTWTAPHDGIVLERNVVNGVRVMPGDVLFRIVDHVIVWALVDVAERDLAVVGDNQSVVVRVRSYPDRTFPGKVALVYPHLNPATRTVQVRIELSNPDFLLRPDMYVEAEIDTGNGQAVLAVPETAVIDSGSSQFVIIDKGEGRFEPSPVQLGRRGVGYIEIREGIVEGDLVVVSANFLIDAESNLKSALNSLSSESERSPQ